MPLIALGAQLTFVLLLVAFTPHYGSGCPQSATALNQADFGLPGLSRDQATEIAAALSLIRAAAGDV